MGGFLGSKNCKVFGWVSIFGLLLEQRKRRNAWLETLYAWSHNTGRNLFLLLANKLATLNHLELLDVSQLDL